MNKVVIINLGGNAYQLEEDGYDALQTYMETATTQLQNNPDRDEILLDIERAIAEKFHALLSGHKTVIETKEVAAALEAMGPIEVDSVDNSEAETEAKTGSADVPGDSAESGKQSEQATNNDGTPRRLYRIENGAMVAGVCNGIAAYLNTDPTLVRIAFVFITLLWGIGLIVYVVMAFVVPEARSPEEKVAASGFPSTAQEFIRRAKAGYYGTMKDFSKHKERREWKSRFKREVHSHTDRWQYNWNNYWSRQTSYQPGMGLALPLLSLLHGAATILLLCAIVSLLATGSVLGLAVPADVPVWISVFILLIAYGILIGPLTLARHSCHHGLSRSGRARPFTYFLDVVIWFAVILTLLWLAAQFFPELSDAIRSIPEVVHQAADDIRSWWGER